MIEVLVALSVLSIGIIALLKVQGESAGAVKAVRDRLFAEIVAENRVVETMVMPEQLEAGTTVGTAVLGGMTWRWTQVVLPTSNSGIDRVDVAVRPEAGDSAVATLAAFRGRQ